MSLGWDFRSGFVSVSLLLDTFDPDGSGFHLFIKDSVSLSREDVEIEEEEDEEIAVETEETTVEVGEKVVVEGWAETWGENATGVEENTVVEEERVEVEEEEEEKVEVGVVVLGPVLCVWARFLMERSMGEQLE